MSRVWSSAGLTTGRHDLRSQRSNPLIHSGNRTHCMGVRGVGRHGWGGGGISNEPWRQRLQRGEALASYMGISSRCYRANFNIAQRAGGPIILKMTVSKITKFPSGREI